MSVALQGPLGRLTLGSNPLTIGRTSDNRLVVNDDQASLLFTVVNTSGQDSFITVGRGSQSVVVNGRPLEPNMPYWLHPGDTIRVDEITFTYQEDTTANYTPTPPVTVHENPYEDHTYREEETIKIAPPPTPGGQTNPIRYEETPMSKEPSTPIPPVPTMYNTGPQWPQYQIPYSNFQQMPPPSTPFGPPQGQPFGASLAPGQQINPPGSPLPTVPATQKKTSSGITLLLIALIVLLVLVVGGSGIAIYQLTRPEPIIAVTSQYMTGTTPIGAMGTSLHIVGYQYSSNSSITFLLDNNPAPGQPTVHSDADGNFKADLPITSDWSTGTYKLTARDGASYLAKNVTTITIVPQGESHTPGPNGAPPDDASFTLKVTINVPGSAPMSKILTVTGQPGHNSGDVCDSVLDDGQSNTLPGSLQDGTTYKATHTYSCSGTYKGGKFSYTEMIANEKIDLSNGVSCQSKGSNTNMQLDGTFNSATSTNGTYIDPGHSITCSQAGTSNTSDGTRIQGTATGTII